MGTLNHELLTGHKAAKKDTCDDLQWSVILLDASELSQNALCHHIVWQGLVPAFSGSQSVTNSIMYSAAKLSPNVAVRVPRLPPFCT